MSKKQQPKQTTRKPEAGTKTTATTTPVAASVKLKFGLGLLIATFAFMLYAQSISFEYVYDDEGAIQLNTLTKKGIAAIPELFKTDYWYGYRQDLRVPSYRPVPLAMYAVEWQLSPDNPHLSHFVNVLFFAVSCGLLYLLLTVLFEGKNLLLPFACALLYAAHPIHTEVVNNIKSRDEIMSFFFCLLALLCFIKWAKSNLLGYVFAGAIAYFFALCSKETAITCFVLIPLSVFFFTNGGYKSVIKTAVVAAAITGLYLLIRYFVLQSLPVTSHNSVINNILFAEPDFIKREATAFYLLLKYIGILIFPHPLSYDYSFAQMNLQNLSSPLAMLGLLVYFLLFVYAVATIRQKNILSYAILFYLFAISPVCNVFTLIGATFAERFLYMSSTGFCIALAVLLMKATKTDLAKSNFVSFSDMFRKNISLFAVLLTITVLYSAKTFSRSQDWKDNMTLYSHDVKIADKSARTHMKYGQLLLLQEYPKEKDPLKQAAILDSSITELNIATQIFGSSPLYYEFLGYAYMLKKDYPNAIANYEKAVVENRESVSSVYKNLAFLCSSNRDYEKAVQYYDSALVYYPDSASLHSNYAYTLIQLKKYNEAIAESDKAIALNSNYTTAYINCGLAYVQLKEFAQALPYFEKAAVLTPTDKDVWLNLAFIWHNLGDDAKARSYFAKAKNLQNPQPN